MTRDEKILAKVGKLLAKYGVSEEEKAKFLIDLQEAKEDGEEELPEGEEPKAPEEPEAPKAEGEEEPKGENPEPEVEEPQEEEVAETGEEPVEEPPHYETDEVKKTIEGLTARLEAQDKVLLDLQEVVAKLGIQKEEGFGASPENPSGGSAEQSEFDRINRARLGR